MYRARRPVRVVPPMEVKTPPHHKLSARLNVKSAFGRSKLGPQHKVGFRPLKAWEVLGCTISDITGIFAKMTAQGEGEDTANLRIVKTRSNM